ncbi:class IV lanthionine synthetase LanL [Streptomyces sp. H10-C2]|uniref:class IV lanthionine synthetase LanL n=1 Tax=unclassified Streptomyces TaxID=2593676 RepID=UPI0024BB0456|nr:MULTISPECIES: class IV lanthionine synthetase LanL [unclassified Streptomyces]MDJ0345151.1 class IV lanthionine synthetase LanL [Streptomyces sp. PH10-H1]MDJ0374119.1 class IV lanthionine synthetase LanL [Streptomyces sp. H10-C2]
MTRASTRGGWAPDGTFVADERNPWFSPPAWARRPFGPPVPAAPGRRRGGPVLIAGRYLVKEAVRHSNRGGVYRARDERTGDDVLLKEGRPHVGADLSGKDARYWLRYEADILDRLAPRRITPAVREVFESAGHVFLVEDLIDGKNLQQWSLDRARRDDGRVPVSVAWNLARELTRLIGEVHAAGFVVRDFKPSNVVMTPDDVPVLVDMECTVRAGEPARIVGTHGFTAPEYLEGPGADDGVPPPAPGPEADCYSLGATLLYVAGSINPVLAPDAPSARPAGERIAAIVEAAAPACPALRALAPLVLGLTADGEARWPLAKAAAFLRAEQDAEPDTESVSESVAEPDAVPDVKLDVESVSAGPALAHGGADRLIGDGLAYLVDTIDPAGEYLWPRPRSLPYGDACNVQLGAAGVLAVLDRAVRAGERSVEPALRTAARWLDERLTLPSRILPGLYFGRSGTAWALHDAAKTLGDQELADRGVPYALRIPLEWSNPDICHGLAGAGMAQLHFWHATGDKRFAERASECADGLLRLTRHAGAGVVWPAGPEEYRDDLAGSALYGFGHGVAGNAAFLLAAGRDLDRRDLTESAIGGARALCAVAEWRGGAAHWPKSPGRTERTGLNFWCNGTSGVGTFLVRLWAATGDAQFREYAEGAALAVYQDRWQHGPGACHGVSGNAELLLDLADLTGDERYRTRAAELATCLFVRAALRDGRLVVPDDTMRDICAAYNVGLAGVLDFLLRLRHGGHRSWLVDDD